ncbi:MAG: hypothetical protein EA342_03435 [Leptolyngbya sp. LCM1.Bin17]|nr:MAG: hypothetical protein EA342_03435 [Leptolyngbya sp. LCM1.Bin17]
MPVLSNAQEAVKLFELGRLSSGRVAQLAQVSRFAFAAAAKRLPWPWVL